MIIKRLLAIKAILYYLLCAALIILTILLHKQRDSTKYYRLLAESNGKVVGSNWSKELKAIYTDENVVIPKGFQVYSFEYSRDTCLINLLSDKPRLVFRVLKSDCSVCVEGSMTLLNEFSDHFGAENILIAVDHDMPRQVMVYQRDHGLNADVVGVSEKALPLYHELNTPYMFIIDNELRVKLIHRIDSNSPEMTKDYLKIIGERFFAYTSRI